MRIAVILMILGILQARANDAYSQYLNKEKDAPTIIQQQEVTGKVTDSKTGETLPGVNVIVSGTIVGTITDNSGNYTLKVSNEQSILQFSFVGYQPQSISVGNQRVINVALVEDLAMLDEIVVVGYTTRRQSELSSSVTVIKAQDLQGVTTNNLSTMLQGKVSGLAISNTQGRPGSNVQMIIRGVGSIGASANPLIVVDGIIGENVDPKDIATITVLKDAAATGLFGSRAANGVIMITTKSGVKGETKISYNGSFGPSFYREGPPYKLRATPQERYDYFTECYRNYFDDQVALGNPVFVNQNFDTYLENQLPYAVVGAANERLENGTDWLSVRNRTGYANRHSLSISGGENKTKFYLAGNYYYELGTFLNMDFEEKSVRANINHDINDRLSLALRFSMGSNKRPNDVGQDGPTGDIDMWDAIFEEDGVTPRNPRAPGSNWWSSNQTNHMYDRQFYTSNTKNMYTTGDLSLNIKITDWMKFSSSNRLRYTGRDFTEVLDKKHFEAAAQKGIVTQDYNYGNSMVTSNVFNMEYQIGGSHNFAAILGQEYTYSKSQNTLASVMDVATGLSALSSGGSMREISGTQSETGFMSYFGQVDYNYGNRYFLVGSLRRDASSRFGMDNRWGTFYSFGTSWNISEENFIKNMSWIDFFKVRMSYGKTGNANISDYLHFGTFSFTSAGSYVGNSGAFPSRLPNPMLSWEAAYTTNVGIEFAFLKHFNIEIDLYNRINKDLLQNVPIPATSGFDGQQQNIGSVRNRGIDLNTTVNLINRDFKWVANFNLSINRNKVLKLNAGDDIIAGNDRGTMLIREGLPLRYWYMRKWAGVDPANGDPLWERWEDENGTLINGASDQTPARITTTNNYNNASLLFIGSAYPDFTGGFRNEFIYKNFTLLTTANFLYGNLIYGGVPIQDGRGGSGGSIISPDQVRWRQPGDIATEPRLMYGGNREADRDQNSRKICDGSYLRIQNVTLSYAFPHTRMFKDLDKLEIYTSIDYPVTFTKFQGSDPDVDIEFPNTIQSSRIPPNTMIIFGVRVDF